MRHEFCPRIGLRAIAEHPIRATEAGPRALPEPRLSAYSRVPLLPAIVGNPKPNTDDSGSERPTPLGYLVPYGRGTEYHAPGGERPRMK